MNQLDDLVVSQKLVGGKVNTGCLANAKKQRLYFVRGINLP
jgi:hypothetical protein